MPPGGSALFSTDSSALSRSVAAAEAAGQRRAFLSHLHALRRTSLTVDCGDFFEGSRYCRSIERQILLKLYDLLALGNHGWPRHPEPDLHQRTVCANAIDASTGDAIFRRLHIVDIGDRRVGVTAVIGQQAFHSIPAAQRAGHAARISCRPRMIWRSPPAPEGQSC